MINFVVANVEYQTSNNINYDCDTTEDILDNKEVIENIDEA